MRLGFVVWCGVGDGAMSPASNQERHCGAAGSSAVHAAAFGRVCDDGSVERGGPSLQWSSLRSSAASVHLHEEGSCEDDLQAWETGLNSSRMYMLAPQHVLSQAGA